MSMENFIREALYKPNDYIAYHVARELAELHPDKAIIEGQTSYFDVDAFVRDEKCAVVEQKSVFRHVTTEWTGAGNRLKQETRNSWLNVLWKGHLLDVILITWIEGYYFRRHHWIVAEEQEVAEQFFDAVCDWSSAVRGEILVFEDGCFEKDQQLLESISKATFDNLVLYGSLKQQIQDDFQRFFDSREVYERYGIPWKRGALFIGPPGNGKTHTLKALINKLAMPCIYVRSFEAHDELAEVFKRARMIAPCVVVFEDLDSMVTKENRSFFLNELDGFRSNTGVVVLASTNHPEKLDAAILERPSRFDRKYYFQLPAETERRAYIEKWNQELQADMRMSEAVAAGLVEKTEGFSFAYLKELVVSSMIQWISSSVPRSMDEIMLAQVEALRAQMNSKNEVASSQPAG
jgi:AAA+ superfamily predicted ATPase